jgi:drug/metabolite transporter (DMT)-like permease
MSEAAKGHLALVFFSLFVAGTYSLGSLAAPYIDATALMALRFVFSAILMAVLIAVLKPSFLKDIQRPWRYLFLGTLFAIYFVALFEALKTSPAVTIGAMFTLTPFLTAGIAYLLLKQKSSTYNLIALLIAAIGAVWVIFRGDLALLSAFDLGRGEKIFLIGVLAHAAYIPLARMLDRGEPVMVFSFGVLAGGSIPLLIFGYDKLAGTDWSSIPVVVWVTLAYMIVFATLITFVLLQYGNQRLPGAKVMAYTYLIPSWVIVWEALLGRGLVGGSVLIGVSLTVVAMLMLLRG